MQHFDSLDAVRLKQCALTIGAFDGVHRGHQKIIARMKAGSSGAPLAVLTFYPHPSVVLHGRTPSFYLTSPDEKAELLGDFGVDVVITQTFDKGLSKLTASDFLDRLADRLGMRSLWVGSDFALGHQREGDIPYLQAHAADWNYSLHVVDPLNLDGEVVSSTRIREALRSGDVRRAASYLGRWFSIPGTIRRGAGRGKKLGIPTANLEVWPERAFPKVGVYACYARVGERWIPAVTNVGLRPTFEQASGRPTIEAHLLDYQGDLYGDQIVLRFVDRLRNERKFDSALALFDQIGQDIERARGTLAAASPTQSAA
ncbi:MAG: bifunctional riboflavin kinase/FAD synthetase [Anaerolineales bacterium]